MGPGRDPREWGGEWVSERIQPVSQDLGNENDPKALIGDEKQQTAQKKRGCG